MGSLSLRPDDSLTILPMALSIGYKSSVSFPPAIQATGPLTLAPVGLPPTEHASLRWTHLKPHKFHKSRVLNGIEGHLASQTATKCHSVFERDCTACSRSADLCADGFSSARSMAS
jgi:hypothetical protein